MGISNSIRGGAGAGRGDNPHNTTSSAMRYNIEGGGGAYLHVEDLGDNYHSVSRFSSSGDLQAHSPKARFGFNPTTKMANWADVKNPNSFGGRGNLPISGSPFNPQQGY